MPFDSKSSRAKINPLLFSTNWRIKSELNVWEKSSIFFYDYSNQTCMRCYMHLCLETSAENTAMSKQPAVPHSCQRSPFTFSCFSLTVTILFLFSKRNRCFLSMHESYVVREGKCINLLFKKKKISPGL